MGHSHTHDPYASLRRRLDMHPIGLPASPGIYDILKLVFTPSQAEFICGLPLKFFTAAEAGMRSGRSEPEAARILEELCELGVVVDFEKDGRRLHVVVPPLGGFLEFIFMRTRRGLDQKALAGMIEASLHGDRDVLQKMVGRTHIGRALVHEERVPPPVFSEVLDEEKAARILEEARTIAVGLCYCRHVAQLGGGSCGREMDVCMTMGTIARSLIHHGVARRCEKGEALEILARTKEAGMVQIADNVCRRPAYICHCCGCCCMQLIAVREARQPHPVMTSRFMASIDEDLCRGCGRCVRRCPVGALALVSRGSRTRKPGYAARVEEGFCLGCAVCVAGCRDGALSMKRRARSVIYPEDALDRLVRQAVDTGKLQNLIFDNPGRWHGRAASAVVGSLLRLEPSRRILASRQVRSMLLAGLIRGGGAGAVVKKWF